MLTGEQLKGNSCFCSWRSNDSAPGESQKGNRCFHSHGLQTTIKYLLEQEQYNEGFSINFGSNYFPETTYKGITYDDGYYESLVVTLGKGEGDNWWCVLFPPLCLLEAEEGTEVEYRSFVKEILDKYV